MLGRIIGIFRKRSNEAILRYAIRPVRSSDFTIWFNANTVSKGLAEALGVFCCPGDGAYVARWLVAAGVRQSGKAGGDHFDPEIFACRVVPDQRSDDCGSSAG